jgi:deaminated glutathione amidase
MAKFTAACVQTNTSDEMARNLTEVGDLVRRARDRGADFIATPEVVALMDRGPGMKQQAVAEEAHPFRALFSELARETGAWLLLGSMAVHADEDERLANRSLLFDPAGNVVQRYDKMHMFDVNLEGNESYRESRRYRPGERAALARLPWGVLGMTVCYDLRFPYLYRSLAKAGADFLTIPSAFAVPTGRAHWEVLMRARAIETGCYVIAPAQCGEHAQGRKTYGHSIIVAPWGEVLVQAENEVGIYMAEIDTTEVAKARHQVPSLEHDRAYSGPEPAADALGAAAE